MTHAFRYLGGELVRGYLLAAAALLVLFDLIAFLTEAEDVGDARYDVLDALVVIAWSTPALLVDLAPFVALLATLNAFANFDARSEITALRAAGVSRAWFVGVAASVAFAFMVLVAGVEHVARPLHLDASLLRMFETSKSGNPLEGSGFWTRVDGTIVNVGSLADANRPGDIRIYTFAMDGTLESYEAAASATVGTSDWQLNSVLRKRFADGAPVTVERFDHERWTPVWRLETDIYSVGVASLSIEDLLSRARAEPTATTERAELSRRLVLPISSIAYAVLAAAFALGGGAARSGKSLRMAVGIAAALLLYLAEQLVVNAGILAGLPIALVCLVSPLAVLALARWLTTKAT